MPWVKLKRDGTVAHQLFDLPARIKGWHETDRIGAVATETWKDGEGWVPRSVDARRAAIDAAHHADRGPWGRLVDYAVKEMEARIILGTLETEGRVAQEAKLRGMTPAALAAEIVARADADMPELARVSAKVAVKEG